MKLETSRFGEIDLDEDRIYHFEHGIPGFEPFKRFMLIEVAEHAPFAYLQSLDDGKLAFIVTNPFEFVGNYEFDLPESVTNELQLASEEEVDVRVIVSIHGELEQATANLIAPIVLNAKKRLGKQIILTAAPYTTRHRLFVPADAE